MTLGQEWHARRMITEEERDAIAVFALLHDIGHLPFSHVTEDFYPLDDDQMTLQLIQTKLRPIIEKCGVNANLVEMLAKHQHPLYRAVHDKNLGMEKLDYLERDGHHTLLSTPVGIKYLRKYIYYIDGQVVIDEKVVDHTLDVLTFYMKMYKEVYFRKSLVIAQRMFHKIVWHLMVQGELLQEDLPAMTDMDLRARIIYSRNPEAQGLFKRLRERQLFREAIVIRPETFVPETRVANKPITVLGVSPEEMRRLIALPALQKNNHGRLATLEDTISDLAGIPRGEVLLVPVFNPERFEAQDVLISGSNGKLQSLRERRPAHFRSMVETARSYTAIRICTPDEYRETLSNPSTAKEIRELILSPA